MKNFYLHKHSRLAGFTLIWVLFTCTAFAQGNVDQDRLQTIREYYYGMQTNIDSYQRVEVDAETIAFLQNGKPAKVIVTKGEHYFESYFDTEGELLLIVELFGDDTHLFYYGPSAGGTDQARQSPLIMYKKTDGSLEPQDSETFKTKGPEKRAMAWELYDLTVEKPAD